MSPRLASKAAGPNKIQRMCERFWISQHTHGQTWTSELEEQKSFIKASHAKAASYTSGEPGRKKRGRKGGSGSSRHWWKFPPAMAASALPSDRPCMASRPCQGNKDAWCDLTCNASLNLREWNKWSGPVADVSKRFYKDKSAWGLSRVHIFIKVTHRDAGNRQACCASHTQRQALAAFVTVLSSCH